MSEHTRQADVDQRSHAILARVFASELGNLDPVVSGQLVERKAGWSEVERAIEGMAGRHELMIIARVELGGLISIRRQERRCSLYLVGNPEIASQIIAIDPRGSFYVPFRVALYDDGGPLRAMICYDRPSSFLATLGDPELTPIGELLDRKIDAVAAAVSAH